MTRAYDNKKAPSILMKFAVTQANIGYVYYELNNIDAAISAFEMCQKVSYFIFQDHFFAKRKSELVIIFVASGLRDDLERR